MPDKTDERLRALEAWIQRLYKDAESEMRGKWDKYLSRMEDRAETLLSRVREAKTDKERAASETAYKDFLKSKTAGDKHYRDMVRELAREYSRTNERALEIINGKRAEFFADGYNLSAERINDVAIREGIGIRFDLVDEGTVEWLAKNRERNLMPPPDKLKIPEDERWNAKLINSQVAQGIVQGESIPKIAKRLENVTDGETKACIRRARTMVTNCENAGRVRSMQTAEGWGVTMYKRWLCTHDNRTRDSHLEIDGETVREDAWFSIGCRWPGDHLGPPEQVWNCFIGETKIAADCEIVRSYKHEYSGKLITIKTAGGVNFTCTPNHPILTPGGWVSAERLHNGDDLLIASVGDDGIVRGDPDINHAFPRIDALHEFFDVIGSKRVCTLGVNFHGDVPASDVEIISKEGLLRDDRDLGVLECGDKFRLKSPGPLVFTEGHLMSRFWRISISALRFMRGLCKTLTLFGRSLGHADIHGFRAISRGDSAVFQAENDDVPRDVQFTGEGFDGLPGKVLRDNIIDIKITTVSHIPVYNLQTENGYYFVNDIIPQNAQKVNGNFAIAHNCRCSIVPVVGEFSSNLPKGKENAVHVWIDGERVR